APSRGITGPSRVVVSVLFWLWVCVVFFQAEDGIRDWSVTGVQTCALPLTVDALRAPVRVRLRVRDLHPDPLPLAELLPLSPGHHSHPPGWLRYELRADTTTRIVSPSVRPFVALIKASLTSCSA